MRYSEIVAESLKRVPLKKKDINKLLAILKDDLPASKAIGTIEPVLSDDGLFDKIRFVAEATPDADARPIIAEWLKQHIPDIFNDSEFDNRFGFLSPISGYPDDLKND